MGKNGNKKGSSAPTSGFHQRAMSLREEISGRKQFKGGRGGGGGGSNNVKSILKMQHLQSLALWAGGEASMPSLGALFGHRLATCGEAMGTPLDPSLFPCQRCESVLQPGHNCTVRIEKNKANVRRRRKKSSIPTQNNVVYTCHFCSHRNLKRGTPKGHMKDILVSIAKPVSELKPVSSSNEKSACSGRAIDSSMEVNKKTEEIIPSQPISVSESKSNDSAMRPISAKVILDGNSPATPTEGMRTTLSEGKRRKRSGSGSNKWVGTENISATTDAGKTFSGSSRKRKKSWSSLKEIAENSERDSSRNITNLTIPFFI